MTIHAYLATRDVRHLAVHTGPPGAYGDWLAICGRAGTDARWMTVRPDGSVAQLTPGANRADRPVCQRCLDQLSGLTAAAAATPAPLARPLPNIA